MFYDGRWVLAARQDHALVAWRPEDGYCAVLDTTVPEPLVVLRPAASGTVLCVAGVRGREQKVGTIRIGADGCTYQAIPYQGEQILDAELDRAGERIVAACADRCIRILDASTGSEIRALAYEQLEMPTVTGRPERCCFAGGAMTGRAVFSTADAYIASWDWQSGRVEVFSSAGPEGGVHAYQMLRGLDSGRILATRLKDVALLAPWTPLRGVAPHRRPVTSVDILHSGQAVSFSAADRSLVWYASDGAPESRRNILNATAMTVLPGTSDVVVADSRGAVWKERPGGNPPPEGSFSTEGAAALCAAGFGWVAVGAASGSILRVDAEAKLAQVVRPPVWGLRQVALIPAGRCGLCWTHEVATVRGGIRTVLALVTATGRERCKLRVEAHAVATGDDGSTLCYADASGVYVRRRHLLWFFPAYRKSVKASQLAVLDCTGLLAVSRADDPWLEDMATPARAARSIGGGITRRRYLYGRPRRSRSDRLLLWRGALVPIEKGGSQIMIYFHLQNDDIRFWTDHAHWDAEHARTRLAIARLDELAGYLPPNPHIEYDRGLLWFHHVGNGRQAREHFLESYRLATEQGIRGTQWFAARYLWKVVDSVDEAEHWIDQAIKAAPAHDPESRRPIATPPGPAAR